MDNKQNQTLTDETLITSTTPDTSVEVIPSMDDFKEEIENSFHKVSSGDLLTGTVIGISDTDVIVDLGMYTEGIIRLEDISDDPNFSLQEDISIGDSITGEVLREDKEGHLLLSKKNADNILAWEEFKEALENKTKYTIKVSSSVNAGVITYLKGVRAFIPASALSLTYVEDVSTYVGKTLEVIIITADEEQSKLVLSAKEVEREQALLDKNAKLSMLQRGVVTKGSVEKIMPYGAFVNIGEGLTGLVHISQISHKRLKSPNEVLKEGDEITAKIIDIKDGKISLSIKAATENEEVVEDAASVPMEYSSGEEAATGLGSLLANIKLSE